MACAATPLLLTALCLSTAVKGAGVIQPNAGVIQPNAGVIQPNAGVIEPNAGVIEPNAGVIEPHAGVIEPNAGVIEPNAGVIEPNVGVIEPNAGVIEPNAGVIEPNVGVTEPNATVIEPNAGVLEPNVGVTEPKLKTDGGNHRITTEITSHFNSPGTYNYLGKPGSDEHSQRADTKSHVSQAESSSQLSVLETETHLGKVETEDNVGTTDADNYPSKLPIESHLSTAETGESLNIDNPFSLTITTPGDSHHLNTADIDNPFSLTAISSDDNNHINTADIDNPFSLTAVSSDDRRSRHTSADGQSSSPPTPDPLQGQTSPPTTPGQPSPPTTPGQPSPPTTPGQMSPPTTPGQMSPPTTPGQPSPPPTPGPLQASEYLNLTTDQITDCLRQDGEIQVSAARVKVDFLEARYAKGDHTTTVVSGDTGEESAREYSWCSLTFTAPAGHIWYIQRDRLLPDSCRIVNVLVSEFGPQQPAADEYGCGPSLPRSMYSASNKVFLFLKVLNTPSPLAVQCSLRSVAASSRPQLELHVSESLSRGSIQLPDVGGQPAYESLVNSWVGVEVPEGHAVMLSVVQVVPVRQVHWCLINVYLYLGVLSDDGLEAKVCAMERHEPAVYDADRFYVQVKTDEAYEPVALENGVEVLFSFHEDSSRPRRLPDRDGGGRWNCSVPHWPDFRHHFPCDLVPQCLRAEDEGGCSYTTPECGEGFFSAGGGCFAFRVPGDGGISWNDASNECLRLGTRLASLNTARQWEEVLRLLARQHFVYLHVGMRTVGNSLPRAYRAEWMWVDGTVDHFKRLPPSLSCHACSSLFGLVMSRTTLTEQSCQSHPGRDPFLCEKDIEVSPQSAASGVVLADIAGSFATTTTTTNVSRSSVLCPEGHTTHAYLACDADSACWGPRRVELGPLETPCPAPMDPLPPSFPCRSRAERVPYPLVCDHRPDCRDGSDEDFCEYPPCALPAPFHCSASQCVPRHRLCDGQEDCYNQADEDSCGSGTSRSFSNEASVIPPPGLVTLERTGRFVVRPLPGASDNETGVVRCPDTHFRCVRSEPFYCLPVPLRCNDVYDCPSHEDEAGCDSYACPGYYRCRASRVCVHPDHVCDGIHHCPQHDDELLCDLRCPDHCLCYGTAFFCSSSASSSSSSSSASPLPPAAGLYPEALRFLEARETRTTPADLANSVMLVHLGLARCRLTRLQLPRLPNLHFLDLSDNGIVSLDQEHLALLLPNLRELSLAGNPLTSSLFAGDVQYQQRAFESLIILDVSHVRFLQLNGSVFSAFSALRTLNFSGSGVQQILDGGFQPLTELRSLDLRGSPIADFPPNVFQGLGKLETVFADNYKLCCPVNLPAHFNPADCHAPVDEVSSCDNLLRSDVYRAFLSVFAVLALLGNLCSFGLRVCLAEHRAAQAFGVFVTHLCVSDFLMGAYLAVVGVADRLYQGTYVWQDRAWRTSAFCGLAGFLSLLSSEVSAFLICLITLDRFLVLRFPFSRVRFGRASAHGACLAAWLTGVLLAAAPLLPQTAHWEFYSQTGICIPLPVTRKAFPGQSYSFGVMILLNFVLFLFIAVGQAVIYWSIRSNSLTATTDSATSAGGAKKTRSRDLTIARRLLTVAASDFLCWFPIGVLGLAASAGRRVPGEVSVAVAILVLPLNSALNPFLYTLNMALERRERAREQRLTAILVSRLKSTKTSAMTH